MSKIFETVSFHIVKPCNMKCKFCYATFEDMHVGPQMSYRNAVTVIDKLADAGVQKITFAGGEPLLYKHIKQVIFHSKAIGLTTSIITNGSLLTLSWLSEMKPYLNWLGLSIDSLNEDTNLDIGRWAAKKVYYRELVTKINELGYRLKINTVVNRFNHDENMNGFISSVSPDRWKVFQTLRIEGQNDKQFEDISCTDKEFQAFIDRHDKQPSLVPENNEAMTGSYLLIDPLGRLFENSVGRHTYSDSLIDNKVDDCLDQIKLDRSMFEKRGGIYQW